MSEETETIEDLIRVNLIQIVQWVAIRPEAYSTLTPFQQKVADLAAKYDVPSPFDPIPQA